MRSKKGGWRLHLLHTRIFLLTCFGRRANRNPSQHHKSGDPGKGEKSSSDVQCSHHTKMVSQNTTTSDADDVQQRAGGAICPKNAATVFIGNTALEQGLLGDEEANNQQTYHSNQCECQVEIGEIEDDKQDEARRCGAHNDEVDGLQTFPDLPQED